MKKILAITAILMISGISLLAQAPPAPPVDPSNGGTLGPVGGGGAPIDGSLTLFLAIVAAYGGRMLYKAKYSNVAAITTHP